MGKIDSLIVGDIINGVTLVETEEDIKEVLELYISSNDFDFEIETLLLRKVGGDIDMIEDG